MKTLNEQLVFINDTYAQALDECMLERSEILEENSNLVEILVASSRYVGQAKTLLGQLGIVVETEENGVPSLSIDMPTLLVAIETLAQRPEVPQLLIAG